MQHRDSRSAISGTAALKLDTRVSSAHIIQFPGSEYSAQQIDDISSCHPADESRRNHLVRVAYHHRWHFVIHADPHFR